MPSAVGPSVSSSASSSRRDFGGGIRSIFARVPSKVFRRSGGNVTLNGSCRVGLPGFCVLAGRDYGICPAVSDGIVTLAGIVGAVCGNTADLLSGRDLVEQFRQHGCIANVATGELDRSDFQSFLVNPEVNLAPDAAFGAAMLAGIPLPFALDLDPGTVDEQV